MKFKRWGARFGNDSGIILIIVLWMLVILSLLAIGLGRTARIELALTKYSKGKLKARYIARGGLMYARNLIRKDTFDEAMSHVDTLYACGLAMDDDKSPEDILKNIPLGGGRFDIDLQDEERRININAITAANSKVLGELIRILGVDEETADTVASSVVDRKNLVFDSIEEFLMVRDMTPEIYAKFKDFVTVFPKGTPALLININTASGTVLRALARSFTDRTNTYKDDADALVEKITAYRAGEDGQEMTGDDRAVAINELGLNTSQRIIFLAMQKNIQNSSRYLRVRVTGVDGTSRVESRVEAVVFRDDVSIVSWKRD